MRIAIILRPDAPDEDPKETGHAARSRTSPVVSPAAARLVRPARPRPALAPDARSVPGARGRNTAATHASRPRAAKVQRVARPLPDVRGARSRRRARRRPHLVPARLQHPAKATTGDRARIGRALR